MINTLVTERSATRKYLAFCQIRHHHLSVSASFVLLLYPNLYLQIALEGIQFTLAFKVLAAYTWLFINFQIITCLLDCLLSFFNCQIRICKQQ
jgi:hypothetical protein